MCFCDCFVVECTDQQDVLFLVDGSESILSFEFDLLRNFVLDLADRLPVSVNQSNLLLSEYSTDYRLLSPSRVSSSSEMVDTIQNQLNQSLGITNTATALRRSALDLNRLGRPGVQQVIVLITDGATSPDDAVNLGSTIATLREANITTVAVGIGRAFTQPGAQQELLDISGSPDRTFEIMSFEESRLLVDDLSVSIGSIETCLDIPSSKCLLSCPVLMLCRMSM